jgi:hypothetical protein
MPDQNLDLAERVDALEARLAHVELSLIHI